jgi:hypothetical protein
MADFALDLLLDKPCLIVTHHQYFEQGFDALQSTVQSLNSLEPSMTWTNLETGITSTYSIQKDSEGERKVRLYSSRTTLAASPEETISFTKRETEPDVVTVFVSSRPQSFGYANGDLNFSIKPSGNDLMTVEVRGEPEGGAIPSLQSRQYRLKVTARRYLTELRDNYLSRLPGLSSSATSMGRRLGRTA